MGDRPYPRKKAEYVAWVIPFNNEMQTNGPAYGVPASLLADLGAETPVVITDFTDEEVAVNAAHAATAKTNGSIATNQGTVSAIIKIVKAAGIATNANMEAAGITPDDATPSTPGPSAIEGMNPPLLLVGMGARGMLKVHWGPNPGNEQQNGQPDGVHGAQIHFFVGDAPPTMESQWQPIPGGGNSPSSPYDHTFPGISAPQRVWYRARYMDTRMRPGTWSGIEDGTVGP